MSSFTPTAGQEGLIRLVEGSHLIQAPPGSGKTEVLTRRVIALLDAHPEETFRVLGLTFTTKAAENLRQRVRAVVGATGSERVTACTFHAFCLTALQDYGHFVQFPADTTVYEADSDRLDVLGRALTEEGMPVHNVKELRQMLERLGVAKRDLASPEGMTDRDQAVAYAAYNRVLRRFHACDFDDLLWLTWKLFTEVPKVAKHYRRMYRFIMVDEAQDTSRAQYEILKALCGTEHRNVMMVADSEQFIYRFAGASDKWLEAFVRDFGAQTHHLVENFRCAGTIVEAAGKLASSTRGGPRIVVTGGTPPAGVIVARAFPSEADEAVGVVSWVEGLLKTGLDRTVLYASESNIVVPEDVCVLGRNRYVVAAILEEFKRRGIEALFRAGRKGLVETQEAELVIQGLRVLQNPSDVVTKESVFAKWAPGFVADEESDSSAFFDALIRASPPATDVCRVFLGARQPVNVTVLVRSLLEVLKASGAACAGPEPDRAFLLEGDRKTLEERWRQYSGHITPEARSLGGFLGELALAGQSVIDGPGVRVLTVHTAKGLEFKAVAIVGMNEGTMPDYRNSSRAADVADERRIAYVAVTRASRALLLTRARVRQMPWGDPQVQQVSRFVTEMGLHMVDG